MCEGRKETYCWFCGVGKMVWNADFDFEDYNIESEDGGVVAVLSCPCCGAMAEFYSPIEE